MIGFTFGYVGGRTKTPGTNSTLLVGLITLIGSATLFATTLDLAGLFMGMVALGYFGGVTIGRAMIEVHEMNEQLWAGIKRKKLGKEREERRRDR